MFRESAFDGLVTTGSTVVTMQGDVCPLRDERNSRQEILASFPRRGEGGRGGILAQKGWTEGQKKIDLRFPLLI